MIPVKEKFHWGAALLMAAAAIGTALYSLRTPYDSTMSPDGSARIGKLRWNLSENSLCEATVSRLTPMTTAPAASISLK